MASGQQGTAPDDARNATTRMMATNERQRAVYDDDRGADTLAQENLPGRVWGWGRRILWELEDELPVRQFVEERHTAWLGDLSTKRTLELGCSNGTPFSLGIAARSGEYVGIDLSPQQVAKFRERIAARGLGHARAEVVDFLAPDFPLGTFDVVYARAVMHHFEYFDAFLQVLWDRLRPGGIVISHDPLETALTPRLVRGLYRPFQKDAAWEWPFTRQTFQPLRRYFDIERVQGVMGWAKWAYPLALVPGMHRVALAVGARGHARDVREAEGFGPGLWRCLHVSMRLRRRESP